MSPVYLSYDSFSEEQNFNFNLPNLIDPDFDSLLSYDQPFLTFLDDNNSSSAINNAYFPTTFSDETRESKKQKTCVEDSLDNISSCYNNGSLSFSSSSAETITRTGSTNSVNNNNTLSAAHFRNHILRYTQQYLANEEVLGLEEVQLEEEARFEEEVDTGDGMKLVQLLISCAEAVACRDKSHASLLLNELRGRALVFGSSFQRVASCFVQGLVDRLAQVQPLGRVSCVAPIMNIMDDSSDKEIEALSLAYEICPYIRFSHFVANSLILDALEGESFVHIVDLGMSLGLPHGHQWRELIRSLSNRSGPSPKRVRITGVGLCVEKFQVIGEELEAYGKSVGVNLGFSYVESNLENLKSEDFKIDENEIVIVNSIFQLHCVVKESRGALNSVLQTIHKLKSKILVLVEQDSSHNGPFFLGRFMEALHYYSAIFDSLDEMLPKYDTRRAKIEQFYFAEEIKNIVSCEGAARLERHERVDQWRRRMSRAGFQANPIKMMAQAKEWIGNVSASESYTIVEEKGCLVLGWKSKPIVAASCWKC